MTAGAVPITTCQLALSVVLVCVAGGVAAAMRLGLLRSIIWATIRTVVQLSLVGYALVGLFTINNPVLVVGVVIVMCLIAARESRGRAPNVPEYSVVLAFLALVASTFLVATIVCALIIRPTPWYSARIVLPIVGLLLGNAMNGITLSVDRLFAEVRSRADEIEVWLAVGATPAEAVRDCQREALRAGMTPIINSMMVVGLVSLPGMMSGQILGGADPLLAARYQIVVMLMIAAAVAIGCVILVRLSVRRLFTADAALVPAVRLSRDTGGRSEAARSIRKRWPPGATGRPY